MQIDKIREAREAAENFIKRTDEVLEQASKSHEPKFILANGKHAKILKQASNRAILALQEMRRL